ncbi:ABC transporter ATP-binding protein [Desulfuribacillus stibiiarsenatis]|uniref:ABC transporter ATP-binding protein n=1 Tax=Desulfuribacillus stibiiarsenatis TaxID=1390249 RepID=A0A1E5L7Z9_9FIRM|nr:ABC transporter ATP-binding protein [Desulfuribacillus stibiiarsenatis]OEH86282.1 ABC transporter ATP-binding protein [Desulfuribacillus stibiiarsenatis]
MFSLHQVTYKNILSIEHMEIPDKKLTCIIGESGSGKSTLLKLLNQMISPDSGEILYNGKSIDVLDSIVLRRDVVMLSQTPIMYPASVKENLLIGLDFSEQEHPSEQALNDVLRDFHLNKRLEDSCERLSGGERQRIALARITLMQPKVYLLDEPPASLDEDTADWIIQYLKDLTRQQGATVVMVTHSQNIAQQYADHLVVLKKIG